MAFADGAEPICCLVTGPSGSGKSAARGSGGYAAEKAVDAAWSAAGACRTLLLLLRADFELLRLLAEAFQWTSESREPLLILARGVRPAVVVS
jgi:hypothetical protein